MWVLDTDCVFLATWRRLPRLGELCYPWILHEFHLHMHLISTFSCSIYDSLLFCVFHQCWFYCYSLYFPLLLFPVALLPFFSILPPYVHPSIHRRLLILLGFFHHSFHSFLPLYPFTLPWPCFLPPSLPFSPRSLPCLTICYYLPSCLCQSELPGIHLKEVLLSELNISPSQLVTYIQLIWHPYFIAHNVSSANQRNSLTFWEMCWSAFF